MIEIIILILSPLTICEFIPKPNSVPIKLFYKLPILEIKANLHY